MRIRFTYSAPVLLLIALLTGGCLGNKSANPTPAPSGNYAGTFRLLHRSHGATKTDTSKANIQLMLASGGTFTVLGDTALIHAGSKGKYIVTGDYLGFVDDTYPPAGKPSKIHLNGYYNFYYDGTSVLQMIANSADTLAVQYDLKKVN